jgi:membrane protease YdiL (CAAX protease family)
MNHSRKIQAIVIALLASVLFVPLFIFRSLGPFDFWWWMSFNLVLLIGLSLAADKSYLSSVLSDLKSMPARKVSMGILSALLLYGIFFAGNWLARQLLPFAENGIGHVYSFKAGASPLRIILLMVFLIGPGEEFFWRGFLQRHWQARFGPVPGWLLSTAFYALIHAGSGNVMLMLAAGVCGLFWGALYLRYRSVLLVAASHTLWDLLVFIVVPFA